MLYRAPSKIRKRELPTHEIEEMLNDKICRFESQLKLLSSLNDSFGDMDLIPSVMQPEVNLLKSQVKDTYKLLLEQGVLPLSILADFGKTLLQNDMIQAKEKIETAREKNRGTAEPTLLIDLYFQDRKFFSDFYERYMNPDVELEGFDREFALQFEKKQGKQRPVRVPVIEEVVNEPVEEIIEVNEEGGDIAERVEPIINDPIIVEEQEDNKSEQPERRARFQSGDVDSDQEEVKIGDPNPPPKKKPRGKSVGGKLKPKPMSPDIKESDVQLGVVIPLSQAKQKKLDDENRLKIDQYDRLKQFYMTDTKTSFRQYAQELSEQWDKMPVNIKKTQLNRVKFYLEVGDLLSKKSPEQLDKFIKAKNTQLTLKNTKDPYTDQTQFKMAKKKKTMFSDLSLLDDLRVFYQRVKDEPLQ